MSQTQTPDDFFKLLKKYEERFLRLERAATTPQGTPIEFMGEGLAPDLRIRRNSSGNFVIEKKVDGSWVEVLSAGGAAGAPVRPAPFYQTTPAQMWTVPFVGDTPPAYMVFNNAGERVHVGSVIDVAMHRIYITFSSDTTGVVYFSA